MYLHLRNYTLLLFLVLLLGCGGGNTDTDNSDPIKEESVQKEYTITTTQTYKRGYFTGFNHQNGNNLFEEADGTLHITFIENYELFYALSKDNGKTWKKEKIITGHNGALKRASVTVNGDGKVFIGFTTHDKFNYANPTKVAYGTNFEYDLYCATNINSSWSIEKLYTHKNGTTGREIAGINVDKENNIYIFANYYGWWSYGGTAYEYIRSAQTNKWNSGKEILKYSDTVVDKFLYGYYKSHIDTNGDITLVMMRHRSGSGVDDKLLYIKKESGLWKQAVEIDSPNRTNARTYHFDTAIDKNNHIYLVYLKNNRSGVPEVQFSTDFGTTTPIYTGGAGDIIHGIKIHSDAEGNLVVLINNDTTKSILLTKKISDTSWSSENLQTELTKGIVSEVSSIQTDNTKGYFSNFKMSYFGKHKTLSGEGPFPSRTLYFYNHSKSGESTTTNNNTPPSNTTTKRLTIGHSGGVDFSENNTNVEWEKQDGYTVTWSPSGKYVAGEKNGNGVWYQNNVSDTTNTYIYIQSLGKVKLSSVTSVDITAWHPYDTALKSLQKDNVYVVKTKDGYAKFKVLSIDFTSNNWNFKAEYQYSQTTSF